MELSIYGNTTQQKDKATQHNSSKAVIFQKKNYLPRVGFEALLPTELPRQLSWLGWITHKSWERATKAPQSCAKVYCALLYNHRVLGEAADRAQYWDESHKEQSLYYDGEYWITSSLFLVSQPVFEWAQSVTFCAQTVTIYVILCSSWVWPYLPTLLEHSLIHIFIFRENSKCSSSKWV